MLSMESSHLKDHSTKSPSGHVGLPTQKSRSWRNKKKEIDGKDNADEESDEHETQTDQSTTMAHLARLLAYLAVSLPVFGAEAPLPVATDLSSHGVTQDQLDGLAEIMLRPYKQGTITGCSFLVAHKGEVVYRKAHGDVHNGRIGSDRIGLQTLCRIRDHGPG